MSRDANFMQGWQQTFVDKRGGADGQNYSGLVKASHIAHEGTNPAARDYNEVRTVRATLLGGVVFETLCQHGLIEQGLQPAPPVTPYRDAPEIDPVTLDHLMPAFEDVAAGYLAAFQQRSEQDSSQLPLPQATSFGFFEGAYTELVDSYWQTRIAAEDFGGGTLEEAKKAWEQAKDFNYTMLSVLGDSVAVSLDVLVAMGAGLCREKRRACSPEEHSEFLIENIDVVTALSSATRNQRKGLQVALPYGYGYRVLRGDAGMIRQPYIRAIKKEDGKYRAQWRHPSLRHGSWPRPGHCPASDYNRLRPRTDQELSAITESLASIGLSKLVVDDSVTLTHLLVGKALRVAQGSAYEDSEWQERVVKAAT